MTPFTMPFRFFERPDGAVTIAGLMDADGRTVVDVVAPRADEREALKRLASATELALLVHREQASAYLGRHAAEVLGIAESSPNLQSTGAGVQSMQTSAESEARRG